MTQHAPLPPSSAARIVVCPGSRNVEAANPQDETEESREGTASHWAAAEMLLGRPVAVGQVAGNGVTLTDEMIDGAQMYVDHIFEMGGGEFGIVEHTVKSGALHLDNWGTPDYWLYDADTLTLYVKDYKFGHKYVSEVRNWQLMDYAALILRELGLYGDDRIRIVMTIVQPRYHGRGGPIRSHTMTLGQMRKPLALLSQQFIIAMRPDAPVVASDPDACEDCSGQHTCAAFLSQVHAAIPVAHSSVPLRMSPGALSVFRRKLMRAEKFIKAAREGIDQAIEAEIRRGKSVPYFSLEYKAGRRVWKDGAAAEMIDIADAYGVKISEPKLCTPIQAIKAGIPAEVVEMCSHTPSGAVELVEDDGNRAVKIFGE